MELKEKLSSFLTYLERNREKPAVMADLRCALIPAREHRAWPHIAENGFSLELDRERIPALVTAFAFGCQPQRPDPADGKSRENMGDVLRRIACGDSGKDGLATYGLRFKRILDCETAGELALHLKGVLLLTKTRGIPVDHAQLFRDLFNWEKDDRVKQSWANHYYSLQKKSDDADDEAGE